MNALKSSVVVAGLAGALLLGSSTALAADALQVTFTSATFNWGFPPSLTGTQSSSVSGGGSGSGVYRATGWLYPSSSGWCVSNPTVTLSFPSEANPTSRVVLQFSSPMCEGVPYHGSFTVSPNSGTGMFADASGGGSTVFTAPNIVTFDDTSGNFDPPNLGATPELDSLVLFGSGLASVAGYALLRRRAARARS